jgi:hypothetical protein
MWFLKIRFVVYKAKNTIGSFEMQDKNKNKKNGTTIFILLFSILF